MHASTFLSFFLFSGKYTKCIIPVNIEIIYLHFYLQTPQVERRGQVTFW